MLLNIIVHLIFFQSFKMFFKKHYSLMGSKKKTGGQLYLA